MKCVYCGQERDGYDIHYCYSGGIAPKHSELDSIADVLRGILEELKKFNKEFCEPIEINDIPDKILSLQSLYDDQKEAG